MMKTTLIKDLYGEIERLKAGEMLWSYMVGGKTLCKQLIILCQVGWLI